MNASVAGDRVTPFGVAAKSLRVPCGSSPLVATALSAPQRLSRSGERVGGVGGVGARRERDP